VATKLAAILADWLKNSLKISNYLSNV
jgi:hypothetical protein